MAFENFDYRTFLERNQAGIFRQRLDGTLIASNDALASILGFSDSSALLARGVFDYVNISDWETIVAALRDLRQVSNLEVGLRRSDGKMLWTVQSLSLVQTPEGEMIEGLLLEATEQRLATERLEHQAQHDPVTGLPNRMLFVDRLSIGLARARRQHKLLAVMLLDLDHFELMNATFGRGLADRLLKGVAARLIETVSLDDSLARFGGDEFILLLAEPASEEQAAFLAERMLEIVSRPFNLDGHEIFLNASVGIAMFPADGDDEEELIKNAGQAMYRAKDKGRNTYQFYKPEATARTFERLSLISGLKKALEQGQLVLHYHPEVNTQTGKIECIEALLRWKHPELGLVEPPSFLPAAEEAGLIDAIGDWVMHEACQQARIWQSLGMPKMRVAVNLSRRQFDHRDLRKSIERHILKSGIDPALLELEITESALYDTDKALTTLHKLKSLGVQLAIDNFGTGKSSFVDLKRMPIDTIKIDQSFVKNVTVQNDDAAIVQAMITMARGLSLRIVAEGVETRDQLTFLRERRCAEMQGFFFGRPLPPDALADTLVLQH